MRTRELNQKKLELEIELQKIEKEIQRKEDSYSSYGLLKCECGSYKLGVYANYNPFKMMAYEKRDILVKCDDCGLKIDIAVVEDS